MRLRCVVVLGAIIAGAWLFNADAQAPAPDALKAEVSVAWEEYLKLFAAARADVIGERVYLTPSCAAIAILSAQFIRYRKDGSVLSEPAGTYLFSKTKQGWRIVAQIPHSPDRIINCANSRG